MGKSDKERERRGAREKERGEKESERVETFVSSLKLK